MRFKWHSNEEIDAEIARRKTTWRRWFAWHLVRVGFEDYRWLEVIWRRGKCKLNSGKWIYEYAVIIERGDHEGESIINSHS